MPKLPTIGLMLGDVTGIGPEIAAKVLASDAVKALANLIVVGDDRVLELGMRDAGVTAPYTRYSNIDDVCFPRKDIALLNLGNIDPEQITRGAVSPESGRLTGDTLKAMIDLALAGKLDGISFAPLNKGALHQGGWKFHDEHQMFAKLTGHSGFFGEMNVIKEFSTFRVTSHVALREAIGMITPERITSAVHLAHDTLRATGRPNPVWVLQPSTSIAVKTDFSGTKKSASFGLRWKNCARAASIAQGPFHPTSYSSKRSAANTTAWS
jgi:4-hydroxythreonine-4-phosphate dehydrogenase